MRITRTAYNRWPWGRFVLCTAAGRPPLVQLNRYFDTLQVLPTETIGVAVRLHGCRYLSWVWPVTFISALPSDGPSQ